MVKIFLPVKGAKEQLVNLVKLEDLVINRHFGKSPLFAIVDTDTQDFQILPNTTKKMGGSVSPPDFVKEKGGKVVIAAHIGVGAYNKLTSLGIQILRGELRAPIVEIIQQYKKGELPEFEPPANHSH